MSTQAQRKIGDHIRRIAGTAQPQLPIMSGVVKEVNEEEGTCGVDLSVDDEDTTTSGIMINAVTHNNNGVLLIPAQNSNVWVAEIDGPGKWGIIKCSNVEKVIIKIAGTPEMEITSEHIKMNGGSNRGLVKVEPLVDKINEIVRDIQKLKDSVEGWTVSPNDGGAALRAIIAGPLTGPAIPGKWAADTIEEVSVDDLQNEKIVH